jgi:Protein of unknown function (DUF4242)
VLYLVESYVPVGGAGIEEIDGRARAVAEQLSSEGAAVRHLRTILVPEDEMCVLHYEAPSRELAIEAAKRAGVISDRVVEMVEGHG